MSEAAVVDAGRQPALGTARGPAAADYRQLATCPGCSSTASVSALEGRDESRWGARDKPRWGARDKPSLLRCQNCGLVYAWPPVQPDSALYPAGYYAHRPVQWAPGRFATLRSLVLHRYLGYPLPACRLPAVSAMLAPIRGYWRTVPPYVAGGRLLDVGCGSGAYLARLRALGWVVNGIEPDEDACRHARTMLQLDVWRGTLLDAPWPPQSFDVVTLWHTLEHTDQPLQTLQAAQALLRPGGLIMLELPNWGSAQRRLFGRRWFHLDAPRHRMHFTATCLRRYLAEAGFAQIQVVSLASTVGITGSLEAVVRREQSQAGARPWRHNRLLKAMLWPAEALCSRVGLGGCLMATARTP